MELKKSETHIDEKKTVLIFGLISGAISAAIFYDSADKIGFEKGQILGYTTTVLSALLVFCGVRPSGVA